MEIAWHDFLLTKRNLKEVFEHGWNNETNQMKSLRHGTMGIDEITCETCFKRVCRTQFELEGGGIVGTVDTHSDM